MAIIIIVVFEKKLIDGFDKEGSKCETKHDYRFLFRSHSTKQLGMYIGTLTNEVKKSKDTLVLGTIYICSTQYMEKTDTLWLK